MKINLPEGWRLIVKRETQSTNEDVKNLPAGSDKTAICAETQTGGRGRMGRRWVSPKGNLFVSFCLELGTLNQAEIYSFLSAIALIGAMENVCPGIEIKCKWPNDLLVEGEKISGILLETDGVGRLIVGIGVNIVAFPEDKMLYPTTSLAAHGFSVTKETLLEELLRQFDLWQKRLYDEGKAPVLDAWRQKAYGVGKPIVAHLPDRNVEGVFSGLDNDGRLLLNTNGEIIKITTGDVFFGSAGKKENDGRND